MTHLSLAHKIASLVMAPAKATLPGAPPHCALPGPSFDTFEQRRTACADCCRVRPRPGMLAASASVTRSAGKRKAESPETAPGAGAHLSKSKTRSNIAKSEVAQETLHPRQELGPSAAGRAWPGARPRAGDPARQQGLGGGAPGHPWQEQGRRSRGRGLRVMRLRRCCERMCCE